MRERIVLFSKFEVAVKKVIEKDTKREEKREREREIERKRQRHREDLSCKQRERKKLKGL